MARNGGQTQVTTPPPAPNTDAPAPPPSPAAPSLGDSECAIALAVALALMAGLLAIVYGTAWICRHNVPAARATIWVGVAVSFVCGWYLTNRIILPLGRLKQIVDETLDGKRWKLRVEKLGALAWLAELWNAAAIVQDEDMETLQRQVADLEVSGRMAAVQSKRAEAIVQSLDDAVVIVDGAGQVTFANRVCEPLLGTAPSDLMGRRASECITVAELAEFISSTLRAGPGALPQPIEITVGTDTDQRSLKVSAHAITAEGVSSGYTILCRDVTPQKMAERMRHRLIDSVSKEIVPPLADIRARSDRLMRSTGGQRGTLREEAEAIHSGVETVSNLISDLRRLTEIESGGMMVRRQAVNMEALLQQATNLVRIQAEAKQLDWCADVPALLPPVQGDPDMIKVIVLNLLSNAIKFTPNGGRIDIDAFEEDGQIAVRVRDTGCGIEPEDLPRVFDKFFRTDQARSMRVPGAGLGLTLAKQMALLHDGDLHVASQPGQGTEVCLLLPAAPSTPIDAPQAKRLTLSDVTPDHTTQEVPDGENKQVN